MCNLMMDGPVDFEIEGDRVRVKGSSDGDKVTLTFRMADALLSEHRFQAAKAEFAQRACEVHVFPGPKRAHAETA